MLYQTCQTQMHASLMQYQKHISTEQYLVSNGRVLNFGFFLGFYAALTIFHSYRNLEAGDTQSLKSKQ